MKGYRYLVPLGLVVFMVIGVFQLINTVKQEKKEYNQYVELARDAADKEMFIDSMEYYNQALKINENVELNYEIADMFYENGKISTAVKWYKKIIDGYPEEVKAYEFLFKYYTEKRAFSDFYDLSKQFYGRKLKSELLTELLEDNKYEYDVATKSYYYVGTVFNKFSPANNGEYWSFVSHTGKKYSDYSFKFLGAYVENKAFAISSEDEAMFIDYKGNKRGDIPKELGVIGGTVFYQDCISLETDKGYALYDAEYNKISDGYYEYCSAASSDAYAVKSTDGWYLYKLDGTRMNDKPYLDVIVDSMGFVFRKGIAFVSVDEGKYYMVDAENNKVGSMEFEDAKNFSMGDLAAVKINGRWGFVNTSGEVVIKEQYENARSFSNGLAAVCYCGLWGYIDSDNNICVDYTFEDARDFSDNGATYVMFSNGNWRTIRFYSKK